MFVGYVDVEGRSIGARIQMLYYEWDQPITVLRHQLPYPVCWKKNKLVANPNCQTKNKNTQFALTLMFLSKFTYVFCFPLFFVWINNRCSGHTFNLRLDHWLPSTTAWARKMSSFARSSELFRKSAHTWTTWTKHFTCGESRNRQEVVTENGLKDGGDLIPSLEFTR